MACPSEFVIKPNQPKKKKTKPNQTKQNKTLFSLKIDEQRNVLANRNRNSKTC